MSSINDPLFGVDSTVTLTNPTKEDFLWTYNGRPYKLPAGATRMFQGYVADLGVKHFVDKLILDDEEENPGAEKMANDPVRRAKYAERIVISEEKSYEDEDNVGVEVEVDEGVDPKDLKEEDITEENAINIDDLPDDAELYPEPKKKPGNVVKDED